MSDIASASSIALAKELASRGVLSIPILPQGGAHGDEQVLLSRDVAQALRLAVWGVHPFDPAPGRAEGETT